VVASGQKIRSKRGYSKGGGRGGQGGDAEGFPWNAGIFIVIDGLAGLGLFRCGVVGDRRGARKSMHVFTGALTWELR